MSDSHPPTPKKFLTSQGENTLCKRLEKILPLPQDFDCLVRYFFISGFFRLYPALESVKKLRRVASSDYVLRDSQLSQFQHSLADLLGCLFDFSLCCEAAQAETEGCSGERFRDSDRSENVAWFLIG